MIRLSLWLYGKPSWDMKIEGKNYIDPKMIQDHGDDLREHLHSVAVILEKLQSSGWKVSECYGAVYSLDLYKEGATKKETIKELNKLKISLREVHIEEFEDEK